MEKIDVKIKLLNDNAKMPFHATSGSAACDLHSTEELTLNPNETKMISTGIAMEIPTGFYLRIEDRSGLAAKGITRFGGIIDSDYRGEIKILLHNTGKEPYQIQKNDRIAQGILTPVPLMNFVKTDQLSDTERSDKGFHSTGKQ